MIKSTGRGAWRCRARPRPALDERLLPGEPLRHALVPEVPLLHVRGARAPHLRSACSSGVPVLLSCCYRFNAIRTTWRECWVLRTALVHASLALQKHFHRV